MPLTNVSPAYDLTAIYHPFESRVIASVLNSKTAVFQWWAVVSVTRTSLPVSYLPCSGVTDPLPTRDPIQ
jgi:hypothetical protein